MTNTNEVTQLVLESLLRRRIFAWRNNSTGIFDAKKGTYRPAAKKGAPDIIAVLPPTGQFVGIEIKTGKDRMRVEQESFRDSVREMGGIYMVVGSPEEFKAKWEEMQQIIINQN